jgi:hypothetical protein
VRVSTGTDGILSSGGNYHAVADGDTTGTYPVGPYSWYGTQNTVFWESAYASLDVYLDTGWSEDMGFDLSLAVNLQGSPASRDFIFHVGMVRDPGDNVVKLAVNSDSMSWYAVNPSRILGADMYVVPQSGWYTFEHDLRDASGVLAVDFNIRDSLGALVWTSTLSNPLDTIPAVAGGPLYSWLAFVDADNGSFSGVAIDNHFVNIPEPCSAFLLGVWGVVLLRRRRRVARQGT